MKWMMTMLLLAATLSWPFASHAEDAVRDAAQRIAVEAGTHRVIAIGEMHGTREAPAVVAALASRYAEDGPLLVGLEVPRSEHAALKAYMASTGGDASRARLRQQPFWDVPPQRNDGRRSEDMLDLVEALRRLRAQGRDVAIVPFDIVPGSFVDGTTRSRDMADYLRRAFDALSRGRMLVLAGNAHVRLSPLHMIDGGRYRTMFQRLHGLQPFAINLGAEGGAFWACSGMECGLRQVSPGGRTGSGFGGYHFHYVLPEYTAARLVGQ